VGHKMPFENELRFLTVVAFIDVAIFGSVALVCWFGGWCTLTHYGTGLTLVGATAVAAGGLDVMVRVWYRHAVSEGSSALAGRVGHLARGMVESCALLTLGSSGIVAIVFGEVIRTSVSQGM
jgi:hypothetical protein